MDYKCVFANTVLFFLVMVYSALFNNVFEASIIEQTMLALPSPPANMNKMTIRLVF